MTVLWLVVSCWLALAVPAALLIGRGVRIADQRRSTRLATHSGTFTAGGGSRVAQLTGR
jgi:hypothetical protein